jgi:hypothetical protein
VLRILLDRFQIATILVPVPVALAATALSINVLFLPATILTGRSIQASHSKSAIRMADYIWQESPLTASSLLFSRP